MLLQADMNVTEFVGIDSITLYMTFRDLLVSESSQTAWIRIRVYAENPVTNPSAPTVPSSIFNSKYIVTNWTAIDNAMSGTTSMWETIQTYIEGRIAAVDPTADITDLEA